MAVRSTLPALVIAALAFGTLEADEAIKLSLGEIEFFEQQVRPILVGRCYECHSESADAKEGGLWLDRREAWRIGGDAGPAIVPNDADQSLLVQAIEYRDEGLQMPPEGRLPANEISVLRRWIHIGAPDPRDESLSGMVRDKEIDYESARKNWAFRPHGEQAQSPPGHLHADDWSLGRIDAFLLERLREHGLEPSADAEPSILLRRLYFDLTGLPPTPAEVAKYLADPSEQALEQVVDELIGRPSFGQKWGRHWLDVARYADSNGADVNWLYPQAWRYRDYVIDSFNGDRSFYEFVRQQIAGDLMPAASHDQRREQLIAATFLSLGPKQLTERDKEKMRLDVADEQVDTVGQAFLGLTLGCARCHDHKFDPVSQEDYYALAGIFRSTQVVTGTRDGCVNGSSWVEQPLPTTESQASELTTRVEQLELIMRLAVERGFKDKAGGKMTLDNLPLAGIVYDQSDAEQIGDWTHVTQSAQGFGSDSIHDNGQSKGKKRVVFRGNMPENALYEIRVAYKVDPRNSTDVPVVVEAQDGTKRVTLDQTQPPEIGGIFQPIGRFRLEKGRTINVTIETTGTSGLVSIDALQFIAIADIEREARALDGRESEIDKLVHFTLDELKDEIKERISELRYSELAMAPRDAPDAGDINVRVRGESGRLGKLVRRGFPRVLHDGPQPKIASGRSGRLELADWITSPDNALLDRVFVNRAWHHLFGRGIVASVDNFGSLGQTPTHPELLDDLASSFRASGGSIKSLVRRLVLSRSYRLGATVSRPHEAADPANDWFGRHNRRRLTAEEIRDSVLFLSGRLDPIAGGMPIKTGDRLNYQLNFDDAKVRSVYLPVPRNNSIAHLDLFDGANPDLVSGSRATTNVPTQGLFLLNGEFFHENALQIGLDATEAAATTNERLEWLYQKILSRPPGEKELVRARSFVEDIVNGSASVDHESPPVVQEAYGHLAHMLLVSAEFLYLN